MSVDSEVFNREFDWEIRVNLGLTFPRSKTSAIHKHHYTFGWVSFHLFTSTAAVSQSSARKSVEDTILQQLEFGICTLKD